MAVDPNEGLARQLRGMSDAELANFRVNKLDESRDGIFADKEFDRRARVHQHELDRQLLAEQVQWMKFAAILGAAATLIGAIVGALLIFWLQKSPLPTQPESQTHPSQQQSEPATSVDRTEKAVSVPSENTP